ncbi:MAG: ParB/RepB/Spo0J family partition protein [Candidatus Niyogibacteria bacterium]|nr:ParB/RepB/Spo0J family partition protein [Candidatus Niyogibacteria bacterium]
MNQNNQIQNSIFWVETEKIKPNPFQPRHEFDESRLRELSESIRQYGVLQPLVVVRCEHEVPNGTAVNYELIAGERRLRASKLAGLLQVPVIIRAEPAEKVKLELALVENVQREDLGPIERAIAFKQMADTFGMKQREIAAKIGKSREFVANTMRLLVLPEEIKQALVDGSINEGHTRPLLMLSDKPEAQKILFKDIVYKKLSVRDAEHAARRIAYERARKQDGLPDQNTRVLEEKFLGQSGQRPDGGQHGYYAGNGSGIFGRRAERSLARRQRYAARGIAYVRCSRSAGFRVRRYCGQCGARKSI